MTAKRKSLTVLSQNKSLINIGIYLLKDILNNNFYHLLLAKTDDWFLSNISNINISIIQLLYDKNIIKLINTVTASYLNF